LSAATISPGRCGLLEQLTLARAHGIATPRTVVATDPAAAGELLGSPQVIVKALHQHFVEATPGLLSGVFPQISDRAGLGRASGPPVVVQAYVEHQAEIRAYCVGGQVAACMRVTKSDPAQPWLDACGVTAALV